MWEKEASASDLEGRGVGDNVLYYSDNPPEGAITTFTTVGVHPEDIKDYAEDMPNDVPAQDDYQRGYNAALEAMCDNCVKALRIPA